MNTQVPLRRMGQLDQPLDANEMLRNMQQAQPAVSIQDANQQMLSLMNQQAATLQQAQETASRLWWSQNWPLVAGGLGALGLVGYLVLRKK